MGPGAEEAKSKQQAERGDGQAQEGGRASLLMGHFRTRSLLGLLCSVAFKKARGRGKL